MRFIRIIFLAILLVTPLLSGSYPFGFEEVKVIFFGVVMLTSILVFAITTNKLTLFKFNIIDKTALLFISFLVLTSFTGIHPLSSIFGMPVYYQGAILYVFLFLFYLGLRIINISVKEFTSTIFISALIVSLIAISEWTQLHIFHLLIPNYNGRAISTFGQPNLYSGFLLLAIPFMCLLLNTQKKKIKLFVGVGIFLTLVALVMSESRASIVLFFPLLCFYIFTFRKKLRWLYYPIVAFLILAVGIGTYLVLPRMIDKEIIKPLDPKWVAKNAPEKRAIIWQAALMQVINRPIFGYGLDNFQDVYTSYFLEHMPPNANDDFKNKKI